LLSWWQTVEGRTHLAVEEAADRVFMAARLFVRLFNKRGGSLQQRVLELLSMADAADNFHKKTVTASVGGGVASVAGSITTITGLILAPFTAGASLIVTAVDTVHSKTDRKKVEKMIQDYQEEIKDIKECLDFLQTISKNHLNQNVKHVVKEGGRAGKALVINTENLIGTHHHWVMSGLFLALDVFFLAKDSMELRKGAKTDFAAKIREVCKDLQGGLLELNRIKGELQKTMDGIEVEVEEDEEDDEEMLKLDLKKLTELEE
uniref:Apolipoprotein L6 n=1 Tax=Neogobius melanostomus TaxID=47308 RepID=A0A8C6SE16_9GOBI